MKIAIFSDNFYPEISGISDSIILLAKELSKFGHEIHFFAPQYSKKDCAVANLKLKEIHLGKNIKIHRLPSLSYPGSATRQSRFVMPSGIQSLKFRKAKFDIIYTQDPFGVGLEGLIMAKILKIPIVGTNHTPITEFTRYAPLHNKFFDWVALRFFSWYYNRCQFVTAPYARLLNEMKAYKFKKSCQPLSNPIDLADFMPADEEEKKKLKNKFGLSKNVILYTGRLAVEKQINVIIQAMAKVKKVFPDIMFAITGCGSAEKNLKELAESLNLKNNVKFFGRVKNKTHAEIYKASDIFVIMSTAEAQSLSLMKAMATGIPVIGAAARALPNYIGEETDGRGFVIPVGDETKLAEKIIFLFKNPEERKKMGQTGADFVKKFSAGNIASEWQKIFIKVVKEYAENKQL